MKKPLLYALLLSTLILGALACSFGALDGDQVPSDVLFQDDFSDPSSGWDRMDVDEGLTDYADGKYRIFVNTNSTDIWANPGLEFTDVVVDVDATKVGGSNDNDFGVICRYQGEENFYFFIIGSDQSFGIGIVKDGVQDLLSEKPMGYHPAVQKGDTNNHIQASCVDSKLSLSVNGEKLLEVNDDSFDSGDVGLMAGTFDEPGTDIHFDNFVVRKP
jgi:hypothetical protein